MTAIDLAIQQQFDDIRVPLKGGQDKRRDPLPVYPSGIRTALEQRASDFDPSVPRCVYQRGISTRVVVVGIGAARQKMYDIPDIAPQSCRNQRIIFRRLRYLPIRFIGGQRRNRAAQTCNSKR